MHNFKSNTNIIEPHMDREIKILHTADSHIGYRQYHSDVRRQDFLDAFSSVIDDAIEMKMDAVVHAGDLFDSRNPTLEDILDTMNILARLRDASIPFLAIVGNHESKQHTQWLDLFQNMGIAIRLGTMPYDIGSVAVLPSCKCIIIPTGFANPDYTKIAAGIERNGKAFEKFVKNGGILVVFGPMVSKIHSRKTHAKNTGDTELHWGEFCLGSYRCHF